MLTYANGNKFCTIREQKNEGEKSSWHVCYGQTYKDDNQLNQQVLSAKFFSTLNRATKWVEKKLTNQEIKK